MSMVMIAGVAQAASTWLACRPGTTGTLGG
jgi:hypothetical protein